MPPDSGSPAWPLVRVGLWLAARSLFGGAARRVLVQLARPARVAVGARGGERQLARHVLLAEERVAEDVVVHVAALGDEARVLDVADDLDFVHAVAGAGGADDVLLDHHAAHVIRAVRQAELTDLAALRDPRRLQARKIVEDDPREAEHAEVLDSRRFPAAQLGVLRLVAPPDAPGKAAGLVLHLAAAQQG